jgi:hypothetical protein
MIILHHNLHFGPSGWLYLAGVILADYSCQKLFEDPFETRLGAHPPLRVGSF